MPSLGGSMQVVPVASSSTPAGKPTVDAEVFAVRLGPRAYAAAWLGISLLHIVSGAYLVVAGVVFWVLPSVGDMYTIDYYAVTLHSQHFHVIATAHFIVAAVHFVLLWRPLLRRLATSLRVRYSRALTRKTTSRRRHWLTDWLRSVQDAVLAVYWFLFARTGLFGVQGRYYEVFFTANEMLDIVLQTHQALQMSQQLAHRGLNRFYIMTLVLNCLFTPLVHTVVTDKPLQRLLCRLGDIALDFLASVAVPAELARGFYSYYDPATGAVPHLLWYDDAWFVRTLKEAPIVLFGTWFDALSRLAFSVGLIMSLNSVKNLLRPTTSAVSLHKPSPLVRTNDIVPPRTLRVLHGLMVGFGIVIVGIQLHAEVRTSPAACMLEIRPWLTSQPACAFIEFNCFHHRNRNGNATEFEYVAGPLYTPSLLHIVFRHCQHVELTPLLQNFHELVGFKTYNSTVVTWPESAALTQTHHSHMRFAFFVLTNFTDGELPSGLLSSDFPSELRDIEISGSNVERLPDDLHERWPSGVTLAVEFSRLTALPPTLLQLRAYALLLDGNQIHELPLAILVDPTSVYSSFAGNPITALPEALESAELPKTKRRRLRFASTPLRDLPAWMTTPEFFARTHLVATDTPLCESILDARARHEDATQWTRKVNCNASAGGVGYYPQHVDARASELRW